VGLRKKQDRESLCSRRIGAVTLRECGGVTQGTSRRFVLASVRSAQKPQEGRQTQFATAENADSPAIETLERPLHLV